MLLAVTDSKRTPTLGDTLATRPDGELVRRRARVRVIEGPDASVERTIERESLVVGSGRGADLVLGDRRVSTAHLELSLAPHGIRVRDLDSRNGTFVGEVQISAAVLPFGTVLRIGRTRIEILEADEPVSLEPSTRKRFGTLVGASPAMRRLYAVLDHVACTDAAVLLHGERGVGKTAAALSLHRESRRPGEVRFVDLDLAPDEAAIRRELAAAGGGTVVLDNVDRSSAGTAAALSRALASHESAPPPRARIVSTAREDPRALVADGALSRDVYFHVAAVCIAIPPLRDRTEDVPALVAELVPPGRDVRYPEIERLRAAGFPGNVRELRGVLDAGLPSVSPPPPPSTSEPIRFHEAKQVVVDRFERDYLARMLEENGGNVSKAARAAGVARSHFIALLQKHGLA
jgi:DNA-binding NtrC family response regulator